MSRKTQAHDNIELDVIDAQAQGYGCHYGRYKADHPHTAAANEARLETKPKQATTTRPIYERICCTCGRQFQTNHKQRIYCSDKCKELRDGEKWRHRKKAKEA